MPMYVSKLFRIRLQERAQKLAKRLKIEYMPEIIVNEVQKVYCLLLFYA